MKVFYIADFFVEDITGGAEICDNVLLSLLKSKQHKVVRFRSTEVNEKHFKLYNKLGFHFLISNFTRLSAETMTAFVRNPGTYSIIEHDHKYIKHRDPSRYSDFMVPKSDLINEIFYANAKNVFAQSKIHAEVISRNLNIEVINLGMSLWTDDQLDTIEKFVSSPKAETHAIIDSPNPTKNTHKNVRFCETNDLPYTKIGPSEYSHFIEQLSKCEKIVFFPAVLETFNRVLVEAKMLNCKIITNNRNGCVSEPWFSELSGQELIDYARSERSNVVEKIVNAITQNPQRNTPEDITVILNAYRRPYNLAMQIEAIRAQTHPPKNLWLWVNAHEDNKDFDFESLDVDRIFKNDYNWKFYGRFAAALLADTEFLAIYDDDTIPGKRWHQNCLETMKIKEGILGSAGIILKGNRYVQHDRCGWPTQNAETTEVDLVGHSWFFKRDWLKYLWQEKPTTWENGEDIQFAFMSKIHGGIKTYCPPHPPEQPELHGSILGNELGIDSKATSNNQEVTHNQFFSERDMCVQTGLQKGWQTVNGVSL
jgi:hypothetical protein